MGDSVESQKNDKKSFGRDVGKLVTGTIIAQAVGICLTPVITRIFSPEIYGIVSVFISIVSICTVIVCGRYEQAILLPKNENDASSIFLGCLGIAVVFSTLLIPVFFIFGDTICLFLNVPNLSPYIVLVPLLVLIDGAYLAIRYWNSRKKRFGTQAVTQAVQSISGNGAKLSFGLLGWINAGSLIIGQILGQFLGTCILYLQFMRSDFRGLSSSISIANIRKQLTRYKKFPLVDSWGQWINTISWQLPVFMLTGFFSSTVAGLYSLCFQLLQLPASFIGGSIGQVFLQRASVAKHAGNLSQVVEETCSLLFLLSLCPFLLLFIVGGDLFSLVLGNEWYEAGVYAQILALWILLMFVSSPLSSVIGVLEIQGFGVLTSTANLILRFLSFLIGGLSGNIYLALILFALSGFGVYGYCIYAFVHKSGGSLINVWKNIYKVIILCLPVIVALIGLYMVNVPPYIICLLAVIIGIVYYVVLIRKNILIREYLF